MLPFRDRIDAGRRLAKRLGERGFEEAILLALPRGGVPVAAEIARTTGWPLDVLVVRKLGVPEQPELGFGAVAEGGAAVVDPTIVEMAGLSEDEVNEVLRRESAEVDRRVERYRGGRPLPELVGRTVVIVDDGIATGGTVRAAIAAVRHRGAGRIVVATPVTSRQAAQALAGASDELVFLAAPEHLGAIGAFYEDFRQLADEDVTAPLRPRPPQSRRPAPRAGAAPVRVIAGRERLAGMLEVPDDAMGLVLFAHGSGSSRYSPRNQLVARRLREAGLGTLLFDLLTEEEEAEDQLTAALRFDIDLLAGRVVAAVDWLASARSLPIGCFGSSTGAAAALVAAAERPDRVRAVVSRGGRPDLAGDALMRVRAPTLLIVGGLDEEVLQLNRQALEELGAPGELRVVPGASHLFEEPGALEEVASLAAGWFQRRFALEHGETERTGLFS